MTPPDANASGGGLQQAALLEQVSWIRRLAHGLVADRELAEDLVQETCVVALEHAPREPGKLRQWLAQVMRNALRQEVRSRGRRSAHEAAVTCAAPAGSAIEPDKLVERVFLQRELVNAVLELDEPYRATVLLRYFEELSPAAIAERTGTPLATVQSRLQRALARLRERLDGRHRAWAAVLLPWIRGLETFPAPTLFSVIMKTKLTMAAAATVIAAGAFLWWQASPEPQRAAPLSEAALALSEPLAPAPAGSSAPEAPPVEREPVVPAPKAASPAPAPAAEPAAAWSVRVRVLDADGEPMSGVAVRAEEGEEVLGTSGAGGWCVFETHADRLSLTAADPRWVTIHQGSPSRTSSVDPVLVLAPAIALSGFVVDAAGNTLGGASVSFELPRGFRNRFEQMLEATRETGWREPSDPQGRFGFERVPAVAGSVLSAVLAGYERCTLEIPLVSANDLELVLTRPKLPLAGVLRGEVRDGYGAAVSGARVGLGLASVVSDELGRFQIPLARAVTADVLTAIKAHFLPARLERPGEPTADSSGWPDEVVLVLAGPALAIRGVVLDHEEKPVPGARVWVHDPTPGAPIGMMPSFLEPLMAGASVPPDALESEASLPDEDGDHFYDWYTNVHEPSAIWHWVETDATGRFELPGLDRRRYRLDVLRPGGLEVITSESLAAGVDSAVIRLGPPDLFERVSGRVLAEDGSPLAGMQVSLYRPMIDARARIFGGNSQLVVIQPAGAVTTDAEGRFAFDDVPKTGGVLSIRGDDIVPTQVDITSDSVDVPVELRCHFEVVLREPLGRFDGISVADQDGNGLDILVLTEGSTNAWTGVPLVEGRSGVVSVSSRARELLLKKDGVVLEKRALDLLPGDVNRIEL